MKKKRMNEIIDDKIPTQDDLLTDYIKDQLEEKMQASAMDINVFCENAHVHMSGIVDVLSEKKTAEAIARTIEGVKKIENKITIAMDSNITDKHMQKEVTDRLLGIKKLSGVGIKVDDGVANLLGSTNTLKDAHTAMSVASQVRGIKDVVNNIHISTAKKYDDAYINSSVTQALSTTDLDYMDISHSVNNGHITLSGYVNNNTEMEFAKEIAMDVEGITKVINKLKVRRQQ